MVALILLLAALAPSASANFAIFMAARTDQITCDITTGAASGPASGPCASPTAVCDGVTNDHTAFMSFNTWAIANQSTNRQVVLFIPSGKDCFVSNGGSSSLWSAGIRNLLVSGTGATLSGIYRFGVNGAICHAGLTDVNGCTARIQSVSSGSTAVTLTSASLSAGYISRFTVGNYLMVAGLDQASIGYPPSPHFFQFAKITNINAGTGVITLDRTLTRSYLSTWPLYDQGGGGETDQGGPATIYALPSAWDAQIEISGATINQASDAQTQADVRSIIYRNNTFNGSACAIASSNETFTIIGGTMTSCAMEADKLVDVMTVNTTTIFRITFQTASINTFYLQNSTITEQLQGTAIAFFGSDSSIGNFRPGATSFGNSNSTSCTNCVISAWTKGGILEKGPGDAGVNVGYTMSSGVIRVPNNLGSPRWATPGANLTWAGSFQSESETGSMFQILSMTQDATDTIITTTLAGGFPSVPLDSGKLYIQTHPAPSFTCSCTGSDEAVAYSATPAGSPLYSYSTRSYTTAGSSQSSIILWGKITQITFDVTSAYAGATNPLGLENSGAVIKPDGSSTFYDVTINLRQGGTRVVTGAGVTCNGSPGACSGDGALTLPNAQSWFTETFGSFYNPGAGFSGSMATTVTVQTDQGVVIP